MNLSTAGILLLLATWLQPSSHGEDLITREAWVMGTRLRISLVGDPGTPTDASLTESILAEVERLDNLLSTWDPASEMTRANRTPPGDSARINLELARMLLEGLGWVSRTGGAFDPTVGALIDAWELRGEGRVPSREEINAAREATGTRLFDVQLPARRAGGRKGDPQAVFRRRSPRAWIDTGAFGKGIALRAVAETLRTREASGLVDLGGQLWAWAPGAAPWRVAVAHPVRRHEPVLHLLLHGVSVATSGISERGIEVGEERFGHILDPRTGTPVPAWGSVTVLSSDPMEADILSTALYVLGPDAGLEWAMAHPEVGVLFLQPEGERLRVTWNPTLAAYLDAPPCEGEGPLSQTRSCTISSHQGGGRS